MVRLSVWLNHQWTKVTHGCYWESTGLDWHIWSPRRNIKWWGQPLASNLLQSLPPDNLSAPNTTLCTLHRVTASSYTQITSVLHGHLPTVQLSNFAWQYYNGSSTASHMPAPKSLPLPVACGYQITYHQHHPHPITVAVSTYWHSAVLPAPLLSSMPTTPMSSLPAETSSPE